VGSIPASRTKWIARSQKLRAFSFPISIPESAPSMSKAFTRESDAQDDDDDGIPLTPLVTPDGKNYITRAGYERLRSELFSLIDEERPKMVEIVHWAASNGDRSENGDYLYGKKRLREIDRRIRFLTQRLEIAEVVDSSLHHGGDQVFFGATVVVADSNGVETTVTILGVDEADSAQEQISWVSPLARALIKARLGDVVRLAVPGGVQELEVMAVNYPSPPPVA
jgi:transcription elongation factor GreB